MFDCFVSQENMVLIDEVMKWRWKKTSCNKRKPLEKIAKARVVRRVPPTNPQKRFHEHSSLQNPPTQSHNVSCQRFSTTSFSHRRARETWTVNYSHITRLVYPLPPNRVCLLTVSLEIDHNFSRAHRIVTTSILPIVEQYADHSKAVWEGSKVCRRCGCLRAKC